MRAVSVSSAVLHVAKGGPENGPAFLPWRNMLIRKTAAGCIGACAEIRANDLIESTSRLRMPCIEQSNELGHLTSAVYAEIGIEV